MGINTLACLADSVEMSMTEEEKKRELSEIMEIIWKPVKESVEKININSKLEN